MGRLLQREACEMTADFCQKNSPFSVNEVVSVENAISQTWRTVEKEIVLDPLSGDETIVLITVGVGTMKVEEIMIGEPKFTVQSFSSLLT